MIEVLWDHQERGKQGSQGPLGLKGETGTKGQKGERGGTGMPGTKGEPGQSISSPAVVVSPATLTVNEVRSASFQCSANGNPRPTTVWDKAENGLELSQAVVSGKMLLLRNVTGKDSGMYRCSAINILGKDQATVHLEVNGKFASLFLLILNGDFFTKGYVNRRPIKILIGLPSPTDGI